MPLAAPRDSKGLNLGTVRLAPFSFGCRHHRDKSFKFTMTPFIKEVIFIQQSLGVPISPENH